MKKSASIAICIFVFITFKIVAQNIYSFAGTGANATSGDGGSAILASVNGPSSVFMDSSGNLYVTDIGSGRLRKINTSGIINTIAGMGGSLGDGGPAISAGLQIPKAVTLDALGNIYIADSNNNRIRKIDGSGIINTIAGTGIASFSGDGGLATSANINYPIDVSLDATGNIYIADAINNRIRKINTSGTIFTIAGTGGGAYVGDGGPATSAQLGFPSAVKVDAMGNIYIADENHHCIRKIDGLGIISTIAGTGVGGHSGDGGSATSAQLNTPTDLVLDAAGNIFISELYGYVRKINNLGIITTVAGTGIVGYSGDGGSAILAQFNGLHGLALDNSGNIYLADMSNNRVRIICMSSCTSDINVNNISSILKIFPNPASNSVLISAEQNDFENAEIEITNAFGQSILQLPYSNTIDISKLSQGYYNLKIITENNQTYNSKFIKE